VEEYVQKVGKSTPLWPELIKEKGQMDTIEIVLLDDE